MKRIILLFLVAALFSAMPFNSYAYNYATLSKEKRIIYEI